jgi:hypothetical protein
MLAFPMNRSQSILVIMLLFAVLNSCTEKARRAKVYHDEIAIKTAVVIDSVIDYGDAIHSGSRQIGLNVSEQYLSLVDRTIEKVNQQGDFDEDTTLRTSSIGLLQFYTGYITSNFVPYFNSFENDSLNEFSIEWVDVVKNENLNGIISIKIETPNGIVQIS